MYIIPLILGVVFIFIAYNSDYNQIELFMLALFMIVIAGFGVHYFFGVNISAVLTDLMEKPSLLMTVTDSSPDSSPGSSSTSGGSQVFHVPGQYDYQNAKALCKAYMGKLATFDQVKDGHKRGAEWCDYGWSDDKMVLYPTQYKTWQQYKAAGITPCGRPGVNGGYNKNLFQKLGANCFAPKPAQTGEITAPVMPQAAVDKRVQYWATQLPNLKVSPFNYTTWSE
jgi:hypothetical protein